jgi:hypothetical protein
MKWDSGNYANLWKQQVHQQFLLLFAFRFGLYFFILFWITSYYVALAVLLKFQ